MKVFAVAVSSSVKEADCDVVRDCVSVGVGVGGGVTVGVTDTDEDDDPLTL